MNSDLSPGRLAVRSFGAFSRETSTNGRILGLYDEPIRAYLGYQHETRQLVGMKTDLRSFAKPHENEMSLLPIPLLASGGGVSILRHADVHVTYFENGQRE